MECRGQNARCRGQSRRNFSVQGQLALQPVPPSLSPAPQKLAGSLGSSTPPLLMPTIWPFSSAQPNPGKTMKQQKHIHMPMYLLPPRASSKLSQAYSHCPDSKAKDHGGSSNPKGEGRDRKKSMNYPFPNKTWLQVLNEVGPRALHPSSIPCPSTSTSSDKSEGYLDLGSALGGE